MVPPRRRSTPLPDHGRSGSFSGARFPPVTGLDAVLREPRIRLPSPHGWLSCLRPLAFLALTLPESQTHFIAYRTRSSDTDATGADNV